MSPDTAQGPRGGSGPTGRPRLSSAREVMALPSIRWFAKEAAQAGLGPARGPGVGCRVVPPCCQSPLRCSVARQGQSGDYVLSRYEPRAFPEAPQQCIHLYLNIYGALQQCIHLYLNIPLLCS